MNNFYVCHEIASNSVFSFFKHLFPSQLPEPPFPWLQCGPVPLSLTGTLHQFLGATAPTSLSGCQLSLYSSEQPSNESQDVKAKW